MFRAAVLTARMALAPLAELDVLRYLRVPAIVWVMRRAPRARWCREKHVGRRRAY
jgi:hypothetical protein